MTDVNQNATDSIWNENHPDWSKNYLEACDAAVSNSFFSSIFMAASSFIIMRAAHCDPIPTLIVSSVVPAVLGNVFGRAAARNLTPEEAPLYSSIADSSKLGATIALGVQSFTLDVATLALEHFR